MLIHRFVSFFFLLWATTSTEIQTFEVLERIQEQQRVTLTEVDLTPLPLGVRCVEAAVMQSEMSCYLHEPHEDRTTSNNVIA